MRPEVTTVTSKSHFRTWKSGKRMSYEE
ncbi:hypothetical protein EFK83_05505 [Lactococcus cremoris]|nr:hypothetical protein [Lactococcus cremoris]MCT0451208.1 hypothetical protein [Lactococcus cremoris]MCT4406277.1 hypothetical protein [Lactococcus cremoris]QSR13993.1 KxYKxGKxW signal peptide domain-containing protein [Lactococcus sp. LG606]TKV24069.1 hypothetical protein FDX20_29450 [Citrobacter sp. TBCS-11]